MEQFNYPQAEALIRAGKFVRRRAWPQGKQAYYDQDLDGVPDTIDIQSPTFLSDSVKSYERFKKAIRISFAGVYYPDMWITQEDTLANDWLEA